METPKDEVDLWKKAMAATNGPWKPCSADAGDCKCGLIWSTSLDVAPFTMAYVDEDGEFHRARKEDKEFVAAANPAVIIELLDRLEKLRAIASKALHAG